MLAEFKKFIMKGNLVEIAVGLILALKFKDVTDAFVNGIISPIVGAIFGVPSFAEKTAKIGDGVLKYGAFIDAVINFLIVGFVLFIVIRLMNQLKRKEETAPAEPPKPTRQEELLTEIRDLLKKG